MDKRESIISKVNRSRRGSLFFPESFAPLDNKYVSNILSELCRDGVLHKISFGIYIKPVMSRFGPVMPPVSEIAKVIAKRDSAKMLPAGTTAENYLGLSTQIPMNSVYLTSGTPRKIKIGNRTLTFKHSVPSTFSFKGEIMPILVLALKSIGKDNIDSNVLEKVEKVLKEHPEDSTWQSDVALAPRWIRIIINNTKENLMRHEQMDRC